ncbi:uncharacterized protein LOC108846620 [Raphanus sativus]|uniref:Uncharacterized protein LOC108846620 n=1 Tax=Raphanus sativus TaxID=3726 RepID=A0A6J0MSA9_RAPSA|nr:uncharacterized protein LOC108846620 [Raphanus sativus]
MSSNGKSMVSGTSKSEKPKGAAANSFPDTTKPIAATSFSSDLSIGAPLSKKDKVDSSDSSSRLTKSSSNTGVSIGHPNPKTSTGMRGKGAVSSVNKGKAIVTANGGEVITFRHAKFGPHEREVRFRLIHYWEARNIKTKVLIGVEMLLIDEEETVIQGFIPAGKVDTYLPHMKAGGLYRLHNFFGSYNKELYRVADPDFTITFTTTSVLTDLDDSSVCIPEDHFRFHGYAEFEAACDLKGDLYDCIGHIKLVNGQVLGDSLLIDVTEIASTCRVQLHVQTHDGPVMKLYLWDEAALRFGEKFKASGGAARVVLVTTLNPKRFGFGGGALGLSPMTSSRVFLDNDIQETRDYLSWLNSNLAVANRVDAAVVTKPESVTIGELFSYMKHADAKVAWFECIATIGDIVHGSAWYYIGCGGCHTKAIKGATTLMCKKCGKSDIVGVAQYLAKISVYDNADQAIFVLLGAAGQELTGKKASELVESYFEANENVGSNDLVPVPQALIGTIGQSRKFIVKISEHNLTGKTQTLTVTKVLPIEDPEDESDLAEAVALPDANELLQKGVSESGPSAGYGEPGGEGVKRSGDEVDAEEHKRAKCG